MQIIETDVIERTTQPEGFIVEFKGDGGEKVQVHLAQTDNGSLTRQNALQKAQVVLLQASRFGMSDLGDMADADEDSEAAPSDAVESLRQEQEDRRNMQHGGSALQEGLEDTYPASDPVSATHTSTIAGERKD